MNAMRYKGYTITARTFQIRGSGRWTLDLLIGQRGLLRAFSGATTYTTEAAAEAGCLAFAKHVIDGSRLGCVPADLTAGPTPVRPRELRPGRSGQVPR